MIQGSTIRAVMGRDDVVMWPIVSANQLTSPSAITRCLIHCKRDGEQDVIIDSADVPTAFVFNEQATVRGKMVDVMKWMPGLAIGEQFTETARWKCQVFLFDAVHTSGVDHGAFWLDVVFAILPVTGFAVAYVAGSTDLFSPAAATSMTLTMANSDVDPGVYPDAVVVLSLGVITTSDGNGFTVPASVTIGGVIADVQYISGFMEGAFGNEGQIANFAAVARVPVGGFTTSDIEIDWPALVTTGTNVRASTNAFYNVDPSSDGFALSADTSVGVDSGGGTYVIGPEPLGPLTVPAGGAVFVTNMNYTGGDVGADVDSSSNSTPFDPSYYTHLGNVTVSGLGTVDKQEAYRLFTTSETENVISFLNGYSAGIAFVMAGTL